MTLHFVFFSSSNKQTKKMPPKIRSSTSSVHSNVCPAQQDSLSKVHVFVKPVMCLLYLRISALVQSLPRGRFSSKFLEVL